MYVCIYVEAWNLRAMDSAVGWRHLVGKVGKSVEAKFLCTMFLTLFEVFIPCLINCSSLCLWKLYHT